MNTKKDWQTTVTIHDPHRAAVWGSIFPGARLPVRSIVPVQADLPGLPAATVYFLDLDAVTDEQMEKLITVIADLFRLTPDEVRQDLKERGVPILADDASIESTDPAQLGMLVIGDDLLGMEEEDPSLPGWTDWDGNPEEKDDDE